MARNTIDIGAMQSVAAFATLSNVIPSTQGTPEADWNLNAFGSIPIWNDVYIDAEQKLAIGQTWLENITSNRITTRTAIRGLRLAMSLSSMNPANNNSLFFQQDRGEVAENNISARVPIPNTDNFSDTPFTLRAQQVMPGPVQEMNGVQAVPLAPQAPVNAVEDSDTQKRTSYCFLAAFMMRLLVKGPDNVVTGLANMKLRYESFYGPSRTVSTFTVSLMQATAYRDALQSQSLIASTYTHSLAHTNQEMGNVLDQRESGVLSYLGFLPFSYTGMHAYSLMMELKSSTKIALDKLLSLFYSDITAPALLKVATILRDYERTTEYPERNITFRYCTLWAPQYFASVRSRNCIHLLYTVAFAWKTISSGNVNADPSRIAAVGTLSDSMKGTLKRAGEIIGESLKRNMLGGNMVSPAFAMAMAPVEEVMEEEEEWAGLVVL
ncbi:TPA_asm: N [Coptis gammacytorhabdovirus 1]|nr:TPA_asm: N [Coptis gammacytorhabdovirus 1]